MSDPLDRLTEAKSGLQLSTLLVALRKRLWMVLAISVVVPVLVGLWVSKQPRVFEASASIVIEMTVPQYLGAGFKDVVEVDQNWWSSRESLETEFRVIRSFSMAVAVAKALCETKLAPGGMPALKQILPTATCHDPAEYVQAAPIVSSMVRIEPIKDSRVVNMVVASTNPAFAATMANTLARVYVDRNLERRLSHSAGAATWLGDEFGDLTQQLNRAQAAMIEFKTRNNIVSMSLQDDQNELSGRRKKIADELNSVEIRLIALRSVREQFDALRSGDPVRDITPGIGDNTVVVKLKEMYLDQYAKLLELKGKYLEKHPTVVAQQTRVDAIHGDLVREATLAQRGVDAQYQALLKQSKDLRVAYEGTTKQALQLEAKATEYDSLKRDLDRLIKLSEHVGGREQETSLAAHLKTNNVRLLDAATVPGAPVSPNVPRAVLIALALAVLAAFGLAVLLESLDNTVKSQEDVEKSVGMTFLGVVPTMDLEQAGQEPASPSVAELLRTGSPRDLYVLSHPQSSAAECCRAIRTNILFMTPDKPARTLLITSAGPQEGKTTVAANLAITLAQSGLRVLLVDTDMRRPRLHKVFGVASSSNGLSRAIVAECDVFEVIRETGLPNLWLLPCGACPPNPAELIHAERFRRIVGELAQKFDRVIFDSPPVGAVTDAAILSRLTDGTVLVAKGRQTTRDSLTRAYRQVHGDGQVNVLGCILNDLDLSRRGQYGYYYYSRYGYYYRQEPAESGADA
jgi:succinoglycan biosynthesis transport protein ExoP